MSTRDHIRASDDDRVQTAERLREAATEGRLTPDELDERLSHAFRATTYGELNRLTDDLPTPRPAPPPTQPAYAGFWRRFGASLIDGIIISLIAAIIRAAVPGDDQWVTAVVSVVYLIGFEGSRMGGGPGKQAMRIRIVDAQTGGPIGYPRAAIRWLGHIVSMIVFLLGYLWMLWDDRRQCWHDKMANDVVIHTDGRTELQQRNRRY